MPPIQTYSNSPIAATKPFGITPQTAAPSPEASKQDSKDATITAASGPSRTVDPVQPGALPSFAKPTAAPGLSIVTAGRAAPTPTRKTYPDGNPPSPQPGAFPSPSTRPTNRIPPPPNVNGRHAPSHQETSSLSHNHQYNNVDFVPQLALPAPTTGYTVHQRGTSTATGTLLAGNVVHQSGKRDGDVSRLDQYQSNAAQQAMSSSYEGHGGQEAEGGMWDSAKKFAAATGAKIAAAESEVWRRINKE